MRMGAKGPPRLLPYADTGAASMEAGCPASANPSASVPTSGAGRLSKVAKDGVHVAVKLLGSHRGITSAKSARTSARPSRKDVPSICSTTSTSASASRGTT